MRDLRIIPQESGPVTFKLYEESGDSGYMLLQRLYRMLLTTSSDAYRDSTNSTMLLSFLEGGNILPDDAMNSVLAIACSDAVNALDSTDIDYIQSFVGTSENGEIFLTLTLTDGTTLKGQLGND